MASHLCPLSDFERLNRIKFLNVSMFTLARQGLFHPAFTGMLFSFLRLALASKPVALSILSHDKKLTNTAHNAQGGIKMHGAP